MGGRASICADELSAMVSQCNPVLINHSLGDYFTDLIDRRGIHKARLFEQAGLDRSYGYQILRGIRRASRDIYIKLALAMHLSLEEAQEILSITQTGVLYKRHARDAIICFCLDKRYGIEDTDRILKGLGFDGLD